ncbi:MAG: ArnT family glycosyltransferase [Isosphaeraceae bacterium]
MIRYFRDRPLAWLFVVLLGFEALAAEAVTTNCVVIDEFAHLPAGVAYWQRGLFSMYDENPPLARYLVALPAVLSRARMDYSHAGVVERWEWRVSHDFRWANAARYFSMFVWGRFVVVALAVACGALIFWWAKALHGETAGLVCAALWFTDPNVLAHATIATTDIATSLFGLLATYWFWRFLRQPSAFSAALSGFGLGLALGSKFSMLILPPAWVLMALASAWPRRTVLTARLGSRLGALGLLMLAGALLTVNLLYCFRGTLTPLGSFTFTSPTLSGLPAGESGDLVGNRFQGTILGRLPVPLPADFVIGFDSQLNDAQAHRPANLSEGRLVAGGFWYSPLRTLFFKLPVGSLLLIILALGQVAGGAFRRRTGAGLIWIVPVCLLGFLCAQAGGLNFALRYALPALPFLLIGAGEVVAAAWNRRLGKALVLCSLLLNVAALISTRPSYLSFGNALAGGPSGAQRMFLGSNFDWGQDLFRLKTWADQNPGLRPLCVVFYGPIDPVEIGIGTCLPPSSFFRAPHQLPGEGPPGCFYLAVSSNGLHGLPSQIAGASSILPLQIIESPRVKPESAMARIGRTIYVFRVEAPTASAGDKALVAEQLAGCIRDVGPDDLVSTP